MRVGDELQVYRIPTEPRTNQVTRPLIRLPGYR